MHYGSVALQKALQVQVPNKDGRRALILCLFQLAFSLFARVMLSPQLAAQTVPGAHTTSGSKAQGETVCVWLCVYCEGGQHYMYGHIFWTMKKMPSVSQHDRVNSQAEVAAHKQKHMERKRIIKIMFPLPWSPTETENISSSQRRSVFCETANL